MEHLLFESFTSGTPLRDFIDQFQGGVEEVGYSRSDPWGWPDAYEKGFVFDAFDRDVDNRQDAISRWYEVERGMTLPPDARADMRKIDFLQSRIDNPELRSRAWPQFNRMTDGQMRAEIERLLRLWENQPKSPF